jgi:threonyl-tRNA synthetase
VGHLKVILPDGSEKVLADGATGVSLVEALGGRWAKKAVAVDVDGQVRDLAAPLAEGAKVKLVDSESPEGLELLRHSAAHVMAEAILKVIPGTKLAIGPAIAEGFYYDMEAPRRITPEDFPALEAEMGRIIKADVPFVRSERPRDEAMRRAESSGDKYKAELVRDLPADAAISFYRSGDFEDLCRGPHLPSTKWVKAVKLLSVAGAYWRGDSNREQLQRIYGTAFTDQKKLDEHLRVLEEAKKRDHRHLGKELGLFSVSEDIGPGLILWHPKGAMVRHIIENFWREEHLRRGYQLLYTPHIASERIYKISGHLEKYSDMMYSPMSIDEQAYYLKPMNCPGHYRIYQSELHSYRDLPIRYAELGTVYRYEPSGTLHGMLRVRGFTQDDAHTLCTPEQLPRELDLILELMDFMMRSFGYQYKAYLATRPAKFLGTEEEWAGATAELRAARGGPGLRYEVDEGGGVFYAPKIDIKLIDSLGREWQGPTHQVDLQAAKRFDITYVGADNKPHSPVIIHRTVLGSMERFVGGLIEHFGGAFPMWLAPVQVRVATLAERHAEAAGKVVAELRGAGLRVDEDFGADKLGYKVRGWSLQKMPYLAVLGDKEIAEGAIALRSRARGDEGKVTVADFIARAQREIRDRTIEAKKED